MGGLAPRRAGMYRIGATGPALADGAVGGRAVFRCGSLESATRRALARMRRGEILLLSPGCASWDQFENYQQRGEAFCALIHDADDDDARANGWQDPWGLPGGFRSPGMSQARFPNLKTHMLEHHWLQGATAA